MTRRAKLTIKTDTTALSRNRKLVFLGDEHVATFWFERVRMDRAGRIEEVRCSGQLVDHRTGETEDLGRFCWAADAAAHVRHRFSA